MKLAAHPFPVPKWFTVWRLVIVQFPVAQKHFCDAGGALVRSTEGLPSYSRFSAQAIGRFVEPRRGDAVSG